MKIRRVLPVTALAVAGLCFALSSARPATTGIHANAATAGVDDPPPIECPLCGGDPKLHNQRVAQLTMNGAMFLFNVLSKRW